MIGEPIWGSEMDVAVWLRGLGLEQYETLFRKNDIDAEVLSDLTDGDLEKIGVSLGHRKRLLKAMAVLAGPAAASPSRRYCDPASGRRRGASPAHRHVLRPRRVNRSVG